PMTHDLILSIIKTSGFSVEKIVINDIKDNTFYALIHLRKDAARFTVDSRPSDALAVAVRAGCPIYVNPSIFLKAQVLSKPISAEELQKFKDELKDIKPRDIYNQLFKKTGSVETHEPETGQNGDTEGNEK
ncbi:MAG: bifunctional nuclease family protein, partial [bacterium]